MKLVEECSGVGALRWQDQKLGGVPYRISRFQGLSGSGLLVEVAFGLECPAVGGAVDLGRQL